MIYSEGTIDVTNGSPTVTGTGTKFIAEVKAGDIFIRDGDIAIYYVASNPVSDTSLTLTGNYGGVTGTDLAYAVVRDFTTPDNIPFINRKDVETATIVKDAILKIQSVITGLRQVTVQAETANHTILVGESGNLFTNEGAVAQVDFNLPSAQKGLKFSFYIQTPQTLKAIAGAGDTIRSGASVTPAAGDISANTVGNRFDMEAINDTEWVAKSSIGTWTFSS